LLHFVVNNYTKIQNTFLRFPINRLNVRK